MRTLAAVDDRPRVCRGRADRRDRSSAPASRHAAGRGIVRTSRPARRQSSASAEGWRTSATSIPLTIAVHPPVSQRNPACAAARSRAARPIAIVLEPAAEFELRAALHHRRRAPSAPRTATAWPSRPTSTSGRATVGASARPAAIPAMPSNRHRVRQMHSHSPPATISRNAACGIAATRPTAPGSAATASRHPCHQRDAPAHHPQRQRLEPERHQHQRRQRCGHHDDVAHGDRDQIGQHRVLLARVEMIGRERRHGDTGDQGRQHDRAEEQQRPDSSWTGSDRRLSCLAAASRSASNAATSATTAAKLIWKPTSSRLSGSTTE